MLPFKRAELLALNMPVFVIKLKEQTLRNSETVPKSRINFCPIKFDLLRKKNIFTETFL